MKEAAEHMRSELGEEAVILSSRTLPKANGRKGHMVEITGALDAEPAPPTSSRLRERPSLADDRKAFEVQQYAETYTRELAKRPRRKDTGTAVAGAAAGPDKLLQATALVQIQDELAALKNSLDTIQESVRYRHSASLNAMCRRLYHCLCDSGLNESLALEALGRLMAEETPGDIRYAAQQLRVALGGKLRRADPLPRRSERTVVALTGSTGCGKTSTLAKLATISRIVEQADVLVISSDTARIGGAEQLQTIAAIANIPFKMVYDSQELRQLMLRETERDFIFVDTVGRNPNNPAQVQEIKAFLDAAAPDLTYLLLEANLSEAGFRRQLDAFAALQPDAVILSKLDEVAAIGPVFNVFADAALPLAYFTMGQTIPDDIEAASRKKLADLLLPDSYFVESGEEYQSGWHTQQQRTRRDRSGSTSQTAFYRDLQRQRRRRQERALS